MPFDPLVLELNAYGKNGGAVVALTDNVATPIFRTQELAVGDMYVGTGSMVIKVVNALSELQASYAYFTWSAYRGTTGSTTGLMTSVASGSNAFATSGTLTVTFAATAASNSVIFMVTSNTTLVATTHTVTFQVNVLVGPDEIILG